MDVIGFLCVTLFSSTDQLHDSLVAGSHAHVQRLVSVVKMVTVLEGCTTEEQCSFVCVFYGQKNTVQRIFMKKCFLFMMGSVCLRKVVHNWLADIFLLTKRLKRRCRSG
jgi:hypothetical protein